MTPERWGQLEELYQAAQGLPPSERTALLEGSDPELGAAVASILAQESVWGNQDALYEGGGFLDRPAWEGRKSLLLQDSRVWGKTAVRVGEQLGPYRIEQEVGQGGMGTVYRATDTRLNRPVAIKISKILFGERLEREAHTIASLNHPHICTLYDIGPNYIVMEMVEGETLAGRLRKGGLPVRDALRYGAQMADALAAAHDKKITHRDLKPANVMITKNGVKVLDFGLAKSAMHDVTLTIAGAVMGTPAYMSPEQVRGEETNQAADIWAFGVVLYEMLTGHSPFAQPTHADTLAHVITAKLDDSLLPSATPEHIRRLIRNCVEKDPARRWHSIADARIIIEDTALEDTTVKDSGTMPPDTAGQSSAPARPTRRVALAGAGLVVLGAGLTAGIYSDRRLKRVSVPNFRRVTYRRGLVRSARFAPDGQTLLYSALWESEPCRVYTLRVDSPESRPLDLPGANLLAVSRTGELAIALGPHNNGIITYGTLARVAISGGAPREIVENVKFADWSPDGADLAIVRRVPAGDQLEYPIGKVIAGPIEGATGIGFARIAPDGKRVAFIRYRTPESLYGRVAIKDSSGPVKELSPEYVNICGLAWSGDEILYSAAPDRPLSRTLYAVRPGTVARGLLPTGQNITLWDSFVTGRLLTAFTDDRAEMTVQVRGSTSRDLSWLDASWLGDISIDGKKLLFTEFGQGGGAKYAVYIRDIDGSAAVRLGSGNAVALSPDQRSVISLSAGFSSPFLEVLPVGAGAPKRFSGNGFTFVNARYLPDSKRAIVSGVEHGGTANLFLMDLSSGERKALTKESVGLWTLSPDGSTVAFQAQGGPIRLLDVANTKIHDVPGVSPLDRPVDWIKSGILVSRPADSTSPLGEIYVVDPKSGRRAAWKNLLPRDRAGIMGNFTARFTPDGLAGASTWHRALSNLYVVDGLV